MATHPIADRIVRVAAVEALGRMAPNGAEDQFAEAAEVLSTMGPGQAASIALLALCILHRGLPSLRRLAAIVADAGRIADPVRLGALEREIGGMIGWSVGRERMAA